MRVVRKLFSVLAASTVFACSPDSELSAGNASDHAGDMAEATDMNATDLAPDLVADTAGLAHDAAFDSGAVVDAAADMPVDMGPSCIPNEVANGFTRSWLQVFGDRAFPDKFQQGDDITIPRDQYLSIPFNTGNARVIGGLSSAALSGGYRHVAISKCEGSFVVGVPEKCQQVQAIGEAMPLATVDTEDCQLEPNTDYFINFTYVDVSDRNPDLETLCNSDCTVRVILGLRDAE
jgi:hypothetical protein